MKNTFFIVLLFAISCGKSQNIFIGDLKPMNNMTDFVELNGHEVSLDIYGQFPLCVIDTFMVIQNEMNDGFFISIVNTQSYNSYGRYISRGRGESEFLSISLSKRYIIDSSDVKIWINTVPPRRLVLFNITKSIKYNRTVIDRKIEVDNYSLKGVYEWNLVNDSIMIGISQGPIGKQIIKYNIKSDSILNNVDIYQYPDADFTLFYGVFQIKPDGKKIANSMLYFDQLNFYSFDDNNGFSVSSSQEQTDYHKVMLKENTDRINFYSDLWCNDNTIIASYYGDKNKSFCSELHILNWDGDLIKIIKTNNKFKEFAVDEVNSFIYLFGVEEKIYKSDISGIINL